MKLIFFVSLNLFLLALNPKAQIIDNKEIYFKGKNIYNISLNVDGKIAAINHRNRIDLCTTDSLRIIKSYNINCSAVCFARKKNLIAYSDPNGVIHVHNVFDENITKTINTGNSTITNIVFCGNDQLIASTSLDSVINVWSVDTGLLKSVLKGHAGIITDLEVSLDDSLLISCSSDKTIKIWDYSNQTIINEFKVYDKWINALAVNPDSIHFASCGDNGIIKIFSLINDQFFQLVKLHDNIVTDIQFLNRYFLISIGNDHRIGLNSANNIENKEIRKLYRNDPATLKSFFNFSGDKYFSSIAILSDVEERVFIGTLGKGLIATSYFHNFIDFPHEVTIINIDNNKLDPFSGNISVNVNNNPCVIRGKISRVDLIDKAYMFYTGGTRVPLQLNKRGEFAAQVIVPEKTYRYAIIVENKDKAYEDVKIDFTLNLAN